MAEAERDRSEIPADVQLTVEASVERARKSPKNSALACNLTLTRARRDRPLSVRAPGASNAMTSSCAGKNVQAAPDDVQSLPLAKSFSDAIRLQCKYIQARIRAVSEQASEIGQLAGRTAVDATNPKIQFL